MKEFETEVKGSTVHNNLRSTKKRQDETCVEYAYRMQAIANRGNVDDLSLIEYIVNGLGNVWFVKSSLVETRTFTDLRKKLQSYDQTKPVANERKFERVDKTGQNKQSVNEGQFSGESNRGWEERRCYKCGKMGHAARFCKGQSKCFKCGGLGHISKNCQGQTNNHSSSNTSDVQMIHSEELPAMCVRAKICGTFVVALLDTGSDITIVSESVYRRMCSPPKIIRNSKLMTSFGNHVQSTIGFIRSNIELEGECFEVEVQIVADSFMLGKMIIGRNLLHMVTLKIEGGKISVRRLVENLIEEPRVESEDPFRETDIVGILRDYEVDVSGIKSEAIKKEILNLISSYNPRKPEKSVVSLNITLTDEIPVHRPPRRLAPVERDAVAKQI